MDYLRAKHRLSEALDLARSEDELPEEWIGHAREMAAEPYKTFTPFLGTALLAKATDPSIDPRSIKENYSPRSYSVRSLAHGVLVPRLIEEHIDIRNRGPEPMNNQPFFRYDHVDTIERVRRPDALERLKAVLHKVDALNADSAQLALAAFIRQRLEATGMTVIPVIDDVIVSLDLLVESMRTFLAEDAENGKRAQGIVAALADCAFHDVGTARVNDPSRHYPGDVVALDDGLVLLSVEVRAKPVTAPEVTRFARECAAAGISRCIIAAFAGNQPQLDGDALAADALCLGTILRIHYSAEAMLYSCLSWLDGDVGPVIRALPQRIMYRLDEIEVRQESLDRWAALCSG